LETAIVAGGGGMVDLHMRRRGGAA
jgi:hypothetical protein